MDRAPGAKVQRVSHATHRRPMRDLYRIVWRRSEAVAEEFALPCRCYATKAISPYFPNQFARPAHECLPEAALFRNFTRIPAMLQRVFVTFRRPRTGRATMHAATSLSRDRRGHARCPGSGLGPTARARQHRAGITQMSFHQIYSFVAKATPSASFDR
jgi:hypothetical protein